MSTQVNDEDLFDFDAEVRPMLEALCNKLLERARMETLEEEELRIIREQQREFEQVRNAELIEAQQMEACETRKQEEIVSLILTNSNVESYSNNQLNNYP